jgi:hypothetical protein
MQTAEHRSNDNRLAQVVMLNARRHALSDPLMGSSLIEVDFVLANQRIQVPQGALARGRRQVHGGRQALIRATGFPTAESHAP